MRPEISKNEPFKGAVQGGFHRTNHARNGESSAHFPIRRKC